ncbi:MAG TPA: lysylphosphatidylglycerol synthase transmembrane domain-containing protein, partial [Planctomycetota bacterium]|nr:lysylphosphatidylglycerol synthase transmembrane domain-containing protein [Planctomycetota bacterium]
MSRARSLARKAVLGLVLGVLLYTAIVFWIGLDSTVAAVRSIEWWVLPAACGLSFANYALRFLKWERYRALLGVAMPRATSWRIYLAGFSMGVTPGKLGEVLKAWLIRRVNGAPIHRTAPMVVAERFTDLLGYLLLIAAGGIATYPEYQLVFWSTIALCAFAVALAGSRRFAWVVSRIVANTPYFWRVAGKVEGSFESVRVLLSPRELIGPTLLSSVSWGCECLAFWLIANAIAETEVSLRFAVFAYAFSAVAGAVLIVFPGGLVVTEGLLGTLLRREIQGAALGDAARELARAQAGPAVILVRLCT